MRAGLVACLAVLVGLAGAPLATSAPVCTPSIVVRVCLGVEAGNAVSADAFVVTPVDWRSAHVAAGTFGAGAAAHGYGSATSGPLDVYAGATGAGPYAGMFFCVGLPPYLPTACGDPVWHAMRLASLVP